MRVQQRVERGSPFRFDSDHCPSESDISDFEELAYIWWIAAEQRAGKEIEWDRAKCFAALERIAQLAEEMVERLLGPKALADGAVAFHGRAKFDDIGGLKAKGK
jgi:hypothetical protein